MAATQPGDDRLTGKNGLRMIRSPEILASLLLVHSALFAWQYATRTPMVDFFVFWSVPHSLSIKPATDIYTEQGRRDMGAEMAAEAQAPSTPDTQRQATYANMQDSLHDGRVDSRGSPVLYTLIGLMSSGDYETDQKRFAIISGLCLAFSVVMLCRLLRFSAVATILALAFLAVDFAPVVSDIGVGNLNEIQLFAVALFILFAGRSWHLSAGFAIGMATMLKPTTLIVLALAVIIGLADRDYRRLFRLLIGVCIAAAGSIALSALYFANLKMWFGFVKSLSDTVGDGSYPLEKGNFGLAKLLFGGTGAGPAIILIVLLAAFSWLVFSTRRKAAAAEHAVPNAFAAGGVGCALMLLSSPLAWVHYYVLLIPLLLYVIRPAPDGEAPLLSDGIVAKVLAFVPLLMLSVLAQYNLSGMPQVLSADFNCAAILTLALALLQIRRQRESMSAVSAPTTSGAKRPKPGRSKVSAENPA
jgi:hypothetical protein